MARPSDTNEQLLCSFPAAKCSAPGQEADRGAWHGVYICTTSASISCNEIIDEELTTPSTLDLDNLPRPMEIYASLNEYVVSQEEAKRTLAVAVYNH